MTDRQTDRWTKKILTN